MQHPRADPSAPPPATPLVAYFEQRAARYDRQLWLERPALRAAALMAGPLEGTRIVDLAAGTGALGHALVTRGPPVASITLVDASAAMLARAAVRLRGAGTVPRVEVADLRAVPLPDGCADVVAMGFILHLLGAADRAAALAEARRLLAPGGRLIAVTHASAPGAAGRVQRGLWRALRALAGAEHLVGAGPLRDLAATVGAAGLSVEAARHVPGLYWCQAVRARRDR